MSGGAISPKTVPTDVSRNKHFAVCRLSRTFRRTTRMQRRLQIHCWHNTTYAICFVHVCASMLKLLYAAMTECVYTIEYARELASGMSMLPAARSSVGIAVWHSV